MKESLNGRADQVKLELEEKTLALARTEERVLVLEAEREDIAYMIKDIRNDKVMLLPLSQNDFNSHLMLES